MLFSRMRFTYTQYKQTEAKHRAAPRRPRRQYTYRQSIRTNAQTGVSIFHVSIF